MREKNIEDYESLIKFLDVTARDLFAKTDVTVGINHLLEHVREYLDADRAYVFENDYTTRTANNTYEVCAEGVESEIDNLQGIPIDDYAFWFEAFAKDGYLNITDVNLLDETRAVERSNLKAQNIKSLICVPFYRDEVLIGFLGVDNPKERNLHVNGLTALGNYLAIALTGRDKYLNLKNENALFSGILNQIPGGVGVYHYYKDGRIEQHFLNDGYYGMLGVSREERSKYNGFSVENAIHPEDLKQVKKMLETTIKNSVLER